MCEHVDIKSKHVEAHRLGSSFCHSKAPYVALTDLFKMRLIYEQRKRHGDEISREGIQRRMQTARTQLKGLVQCKRPSHA
eukprot:3277749-Prymnesium_polylepis.1